MNTRKVAGSAGNLVARRGATSQADLGAKAGVNAKRIAQWETARWGTGTNVGTPSKKITLPEIKRLAQILGVNWRSLLK